ncbi:MAG: tyrosine-type recombinase/integrase [Thermodesulfobacteriota bacterium]
MAAYKWISSRLTGVRYREHPTRRHGVKPDRYYVIRYQADGQRGEEALGWSSEGWTETRVAAELAKLKAAHQVGESPTRLKEKRELAARKRAEAEARELALKAESVTLDEVWAVYLDWAKSNKRHWTNDEYRYRLHVKPDLGHLPLKDITPFRLERLKRRLLDKGLSPATVHHCLTLIRQIFNKAAVWGLWSGPNPIKKISLPRVTNGKLRALTSEEEVRLFNELALRSIDVHDQALMAVYAGLRYEEIVKMQWQDVNQAGKTLIVRGKGGKTRTVPLCERLIVMLRRRGPSQATAPVFPARQKTDIKKISHTYWRVVKDLGLNDDTDRRFRIDFYSLRHTFASRLAALGTPLTVLRDLLGHADLKMVSRYSHSLPGQAAQAVENLGKAATAPVAEVVELKR